jgi:hypothetical protein
MRTGAEQPMRFATERPLMVRGILIADADPHVALPLDSSMAHGSHDARLAHPAGRAVDPRTREARLAPGPPRRQRACSWSEGRR